jgi:perosamine synthetase
LSSFIPIARPLLGEEEAAAAREAILSGWVTQGPRVAEFETNFAAFVGAEHAVAVSNCTVALHLALKGVGVGPDDEVIVPSHSFIATANSITYLQAKPVFIDIDRASYNLDPAKLEALISPKTKAILLVHQVGMPADLDAILGIAKQRNIPVVEDAACAAGSEVCWNGEWQKIGKPHGLVACFSFHPRKVITTGDGGMLTTNDPDLDQKFRLWRQHGMNVSDVVRHGSKKIVFEDYLEIGFNYRMTDIQAAVGIEQLKRLPGLVEERRRIAKAYQVLLGGLEGINVPQDRSNTRTNWQTFLISLQNNKLGQRALMQELQDQGISTRRGIMCAHREPAYRHFDWSCENRPGCNCNPGKCAALSNSEWAQDHAIALPLFPGMTEEDQVRVVEASKAVIRAEKNFKSEVS